VIFWRFGQVSAGYGDAIVISNIDLRVRPGESLAVLGRNGTGKTTLLNTIIGVTRHRGGTIMLSGEDLTRARADTRALAGIGWVPQERNIFKSLTVEENLTAVARPGSWTVARAYEMFPRPQGAPRQSRQSALRRRAADARGGARPGA
jgi:branched-chain amino acid transport system ATP-binding protein